MKGRSPCRRAPPAHDFVRRRDLPLLALALGLAAMRRNRLPIETLLLDEGFGTLDRHSLDADIGVLEQLHQNGYRVGLISHVELLQEQVTAQIEDHPLGGGVSELSVRSGCHA